LHRGPLEWHYLPTKYHENLPSGSKVISGTYTQTDGQTGDLISLLSFLESRLINKTFYERSEMKFGFQNYAVIIQLKAVA
jgi:hypothetical protein